MPGLPCSLAEHEAGVSEILLAHFDSMIPEDIQVKSFSEAFLQKDGNIAG
jgi:hypothetical protein